MKFGEMLRCWRAMHNLTLKEAAAKLGIKATTLYAFENGQYPDGKTLSQIIRYGMETIK